MNEDQEDTPFWRGIGDTPDEAFPLGLIHAPLIQAPERGTLFHVVCCVCGRRGRITGRDICRRFPEWLTRDMVEWGRALKCEGCGSKRLSFQMANDPAAGGFMAAAHLPEIARIERLQAWLPEGGMSLDDVAYLIRDMDPVKLRGAGLPEEVWQFWQNGYRHSALYRPGRNRRPRGAMSPPGGGHDAEANPGEGGGGRPHGADRGDGGSPAHDAISPGDASPAAAEVHPDERAALAAFDEEERLSRQDPVIQELMRRGVI